MSTVETSSSGCPGRVVGHREHRRAVWIVAAVLLVTCLVASPSLAESRYKPSDAGHPVRIAAYVLHPVGVAYDYLILRPAWWVGSYQPFRTIFGRTD